MNFLTIRQLEIATRFVTRQIYRMNEIIIDDEPFYYRKYLPINDKYHIILSLDNDSGRYTSTICFTFNDIDDQILSKDYINKRITIKNWNDFVTELNDFVTELDILKRCNCKQYFKGNDDMKYCDQCEPYVINHIDDCSICLTNESGRWVKTPCNHEFHYHCLRNQSDTSIKCPICHFNIKLSNIKYL
jgi:hypothetical protein